MSSEHVCEKSARSALLDARGIFCCYCCDQCEKEKRARYCPEVLNDPNYDCCEQIEED